MKRKKTTNKDFEGALKQNIRSIIITRSSKKDRDRMVANFKNLVFDEKNFNKKYEPFEPYEKFLYEILCNYSEITDSLDRIIFSSVFIKQYPALPSWGKNKITKTVYLKYHYDSFINEVYIFKERVVFLLRDIEKRCQNNNMTKEAAKVKSLKENFIDVMDGFCKLRAKHVHIKRLETKKIKKLTTLELLPENTIFSVLKDIEYKDLRKKLSKHIFNVKNNLKKLMDHNLNGITNIVFSSLLNKYKNL